VIRLVQVRQPFHLLTSWLELAQIGLNKELLKQHGISYERVLLYHEKQLLDIAFKLIDEHGAAMHPSDANLWLQQKTEYIIRFTRKWLPHCRPFQELKTNVFGTYLLRYDQLANVVPIMADLCGKKIDNEEISMSLPSFSPRTDSVLLRRSDRISSLAAECASSIAESERLVLDEWRNWPILTYLPEL
jgi:hypothetical protein